MSRTAAHALVRGRVREQEAAGDVAARRRPCRRSCGRGCRRRRPSVWSRSRAPRARGSRCWDGGPPRRAARRPPSARACRPRCRARPSCRPRPSPSRSRRRTAGRRLPCAACRRACRRARARPCGRMRGPFWSSVTGMPRRVKPCTISTAIGPPPMFTKLAGGSVELEEVLARDEPGVLEPVDRPARPVGCPCRAGRSGSRARGRLGVCTTTVFGPVTRGRRRRRCPCPIDVEALGVVVGGRDLLLDGPDALPHLSAVDLGLDRLDAEVVGGAHVVGDLARGEQRLARHAAGPEAVAADPAPLGHRHLEVEGGGELGRHHARPSPSRRSPGRSGQPWRVPAPRRAARSAVAFAPGTRSRMTRRSDDPAGTARRTCRACGSVPMTGERAGRPSRLGARCPCPPGAPARKLRSVRSTTSTRPSSTGSRCGSSATPAPPRTSPRRSSSTSGSTPRRSSRPGLAAHLARDARAPPRRRLRAPRRGTAPARAQRDAGRRPTTVPDVEEMATALVTAERVRDGARRPPRRAARRDPARLLRRQDLPPGRRGARHPRGDREVAVCGSACGASRRRSRQIRTGAVGMTARSDTGRGRRAPRRVRARRAATPTRSPRSRPSSLSGPTSPRRPRGSAQRRRLDRRDRGARRARRASCFARSGGARTHLVRRRRRSGTLLPVVDRASRRGDGRARRARPRPPDPERVDRPRAGDPPRRAGERALREP